MDTPIHNNLNVQLEMIQSFSKNDNISSDKANEEQYDHMTDIKNCKTRIECATYCQQNERSLGLSWIWGWIKQMWTDSGKVEHTMSEW